MNYFHSPSTGRFYVETDKKIPKDARLLEASRGATFYGVQGRADTARSSGREDFAKSLDVTAEAIENAVLQQEDVAARNREARRAGRNQRLADSDWTQVPDALADKPELKRRWAEYRQSLRSFDLNSDDWPSAPEAK